MITKKKFFPKIYPTDFSDNKVWYINYYDPETSKRIRYYGGLNKIKDIHERTEQAKKLCILLQNENFVKEIRVEKTDHFQNYINTKIDITPKTLLTYKKQFKDFLNFIQEKSIFKVDKNDVTAYYNHLINKKYAKKTIKNKLQNIRSFYKYLVDNEVLQKNPFENMPKIKTSSRSLMFFNDFQIMKIKNYCLENDLQLLWFACQLQFYCFIRPKELRLLKAENFNLMLNTIEIPGNISKNKKTQKVLIPNAFLPDVQFIERLEPDEYIFKHKEKLVIRDHLSKLHKKVLDVLKIKGHYGFYSWKHTGAVKAIQNGINVKELQMQLRHHSLDMVNEYLKNLGIMDAEGIKHKFPKI